MAIRRARLPSPRNVTNTVSVVSAASECYVVCCLATVKGFRLSPKNMYMRVGVAAGAQ